NKYGFNTTLQDISDDLVYDFWYDIKAYRTFNDGNRSPVGTYRLRIIYDLVPPKVNMLDEGLVRRFRPETLYEVLMDVTNEIYDLKVHVEAPKSWKNKTETYVLETKNSKHINIGEDSVQAEFLGFDVETMKRIGLLGGDRDIEKSTVDRNTLLEELNKTILENPENMTEGLIDTTSEYMEQYDIDAQVTPFDILSDVDFMSFNIEDKALLENLNRTFNATITEDESNVIKSFLSLFGSFTDGFDMFSSISSGMFGEIDFKSALSLEDNQKANSLKDYLAELGLSNVELGVMRVGETTIPVGIGNYTFGPYEIEIEDMFVSYEGSDSGAIKFNVNSYTANETVSSEHWAKVIEELGEGHDLYSFDYNLPELTENRLVPLDLTISDVAGNSVDKKLSIIVDTIPPKFEILNVTMTDQNTNNSAVLTKESYDQLNYWTSDKLVRIVARMITPDIDLVKATNQMLDRTYTGIIDGEKQIFYVDVELKGDYQKEELNNIIMNVTDKVGYRDISGLFVERDLLAPDLRKVDVEVR
ncbi:MAG: hypothetical protein R6V50_07575, partial [Thermoplasmatota archaeon]